MHGIHSFQLCVALAVDETASSALALTSSIIRIQLENWPWTLRANGKLADNGHDWDFFGHHLQSCAEQTFTANTGGNSFLADRLLSIQSNDHSSCLKILNIFISLTVWHLAKVWLLPFAVAVAVCDMCFAHPHVTRYFWSLNPFWPSVLTVRAFWSP